MPTIRERARALLDLALPPPSPDPGPATDLGAGLGADLAGADLAGGVRGDSATANSLSLNSTSASSGSAIANALSGLGLARDKASAARPNPHRQYLHPSELLALMRGGLYRRIVETRPKWSTWKGWTVRDDSEEAHPLRDEMRLLQGVIRRADVWGRGLGESLIWPVTAGDRGQLHEPLQKETVTGIRAIHVLDVSEFSVAAWETDPESPRWGQPRVYWVYPQRPGITAGTEGGRIQLHASRVWLMGGHDLPPSQWSRHSGYGAGMYDSIGQVLWDAIRGIDQTTAAGAALAQELSVSVFKMARAEAKTAGGQRSTFLQRMAFMNLTKSVARSVFLGQQDDYQRIAANPSGYKDLSEGARLFLALTEGTPIALLYGEAPSGLSADEGSWWANWTAQVSQHQEDRYRDPLEWLIELFYIARGGVPEDWSLEFNPLGELSEKEKAEIRKIHTEADSMALLDRVLSVERIRRSRYGPDGWGMEIQPPTPEEEALEAGEGEDEPEDLDAAAAELAAITDRRDAAARDAAGREDVAADSVLLAVEVPDGVGYAEAQAAALELLPDLALEDWPHITVLYVGAVEQGQMAALLAELGAALAQTAEDGRPRFRTELEPERLGHFGDGSPGPDGVPVVVSYTPWSLEQLHLALLRALAPYVSARQHPRYLPHATLGYLPRQMTPEESTALAQLRVEGLTAWAPAALVVRRGGVEVARLPLPMNSGRLDGEE